MARRPRLSSPPERLNSTEGCKLTLATRSASREPNTKPDGGASDLSSVASVVDLGLKAEKRLPANGLGALCPSSVGFCSAPGFSSRPGFLPNAGASGIFSSGLRLVEDESAVNVLHFSPASSVILWLSCNWLNDTKGRVGVGAHALDQQAREERVLTAKKTKKGKRIVRKWRVRQVCTGMARLGSGVPGGRNPIFPKSRIIPLLWNHISWMVSVLRTTPDFLCFI